MPLFLGVFPPRRCLVYAYAFHSQKCWYDAEDTQPDAPIVDPAERPPNRGEIAISFFPQGRRELFPESNFILVDRAFHPGDLCKRKIEDVRSGVVTQVHVEARLEHAISGAPVAGWKTTEDIALRDEVEVGDYVIYDDWVGQVCSLHTADVSLMHPLGDRGAAYSSHLPIIR